jgi:hypothetical protein
MTPPNGEDDGDDERSLIGSGEGDPIMKGESGSQKRKKPSLEERMKELEEKVESMSERLETLEEKKESSSPDVEIEQGARVQSVYESLTANKKRAVDIWRDLPDYAKEAVSENKLVLDHELLRDAIKEVDNRHEIEKVNSNTISRVRQQLRGMSGGIIEIKQQRRGESQGKKLVVVDERGWANLRPDRKVREILGS